jgi:sorbitol/mannitol transport system permease protein
MLLDPENGIVAFLMRSVGLKPINWFGTAPLTSIILIVSWQWLPFAVLTLLTAVQSLDQERKEAARMDGAGPLAMFIYIIRPHLGRAIAAVTMVETIFLLTVFAEILVTTGGGPGYSTTNLSYLVYRYALLETDIGAASVGGVLAILLANLVALFLMRSIAKNLDA